MGYCTFIITSNYMDYLLAFLSMPVHYLKLKTKETNITINSQVNV